MYTYLLYKAHCRECGDMSQLSADDKAIHIQAAKSHHETVGHFCIVLEGTQEAVYYTDYRVIETFGTE